MSGFIYSAIIALLSLLNPLLGSLGIPKLFPYVHTVYGQIMTSDVTNYIRDTMSIVYYFVPKPMIIILLSASFVILALRIGLSLWQLIKW